MRRLFTFVLTMLVMLGQGPVHAAELMYDQDEYNRVRELALQGDVAAQYRMGVAFAKQELPVPVKSLRGFAAQSINWYKLAAESGHMGAQASLYDIYIHDGGIFNGEKTQNKGEAIRWLRKAGEQGLPYAQWQMGALYQGGTGVSANSAESMKWYLLAANQGHAAAMDGLSGMYDGTTPGIPRSTQDYWIWKARSKCTMYDPGPCQALRRQMQREEYAKFNLALTPQQIDSIITAGREWKGKPLCVDLGWLSWVPHREWEGSAQLKSCPAVRTTH